MKGTEKQIKWAEDIINNPVEAMEKHIEWAREFAPAEIAPVTKAIEAYRAMIAKGGANADDAAFIIDHRSRFAAAAEKILTREFIAAGNQYPVCNVQNIARMFKH